MTELMRRRRALMGVGGATPQPTIDYAVEYRGNFTLGTPGTKRVTLITGDITLAPGESVTVTVLNSAYKVFAITLFSTGGDDSLNRTAKAQNQIYINSQTSSGYIQQKGVIIAGYASGSEYVRFFENTWTSKSVTYTYFVVNKYPITFGGIAFFVDKVDGSDITIAEAESAVMIS